MSPVTTMAAACAMTENRRRPTSERPKMARPMCSRNGVSGRIGNETPVEMAGVAEELKFVAVKAVAAVGGDVDERDRAAMASKAVKSAVRGAAGTRCSRL